ncbi:MAG: tetratricopeptide repeat protein [Alphaproteobacteria bacterium]
MNKALRTLVLTTAMAGVLTFGPSITPTSWGVTDRAQAEEKERRKPKTKKAKTLSKKVFERLQKAQELLGEDKHGEAMTELQAILDRGSRLKPYERAVTLQTVGYLEADRENYPATVAAFEQALAIEDGLPDEAKVDMMYNMGQLYMAMENYDKAISTLKAWFKIAENPNAKAYILLGNAYYNKEDYVTATKLVETAIKKAKGKGKENWYKFLLALYFEKNKYKHAEKLLEVMVKKFPGVPLYWKQLSAVTAENKKEKRSFAIAELAYMQGMLDKSRDFERLAQLYLYYDVPYKAAKVLDAKIKDGTVEKNADNWGLLASAWMGARENDLAIAPLTAAAKLSDDGDLYLQLGQAYVGEEKWADARDALTNAIKKGGLKRVGNAYLLLGMTHANLNNFDSAEKAFKDALKHDESKKSAKRWIDYIAKLREQGTA